jgi:hypothetical protein
MATTPALVIQDKRFFKMVLTGIIFHNGSNRYVNFLFVFKIFILYHIRIEAEAASKIFPEAESESDKMKQLCQKGLQGTVFRTRYSTVMSIGTFTQSLLEKKIRLSSLLTCVTLKSL